MTSVNLGEGELEPLSGEVSARRDLIKRLESKKIDPGIAIKAFLDDDPTDPNPYTVEYRAKIQKLGFNLAETKKALAGEALHVLGLRIADIQKGIAASGSESSQQKVIDEVRKLGFDPNDLDTLIEANDKFADWA